MTLDGDTIAGDWHPGRIPPNVEIDSDAVVETTYSFVRYRSRRDPGVTLCRGAAAYHPTMFDIGPSGYVTVGENSMLNGAWICCDDRVEIGSLVLVSWNVFITDSYRASVDPARRRAELRDAVSRGFPDVRTTASGRPVRLADNVWIGFGSCILPGVTIGEGSVVGARSVVFHDVPPFTVVAGNPARPVRHLDRGDAPDAR